MAKFTVFFKDRPIHSALFEPGVIHIGRDETNDLSVNSLAIAPAHAVVIIRESESIIKQLNSDFPLIVNGVQLKECQLKTGDIIVIGKHHIVYSSMAATSAYDSTSEEPESEKLNAELSSEDDLVEANLQVMGGKYIGRLIPLKKTMNRLGRNGSGMVIITKRKEGYFVSMLEVDDQIKINNAPLGNQSILLKNNDVLLVDKIPMQFFTR